MSNVIAAQITPAKLKASDARTLASRPGRQWSIANKLAALSVAIILALEFTGVACATPPSLAEAPALVRETIRERFPDGRVKIEREVTTDAEGNYLNHGAWRMWDATGRLVAEGAYEFGKRTGQWTRTFDRDEAPLLSTAPFDQFESPFVSQATFSHDALDGEWSIHDAQDRPCSRITLKNGQRNGPVTIWLPSGKVCLTATFLNGAPVGDLQELNSDDKLHTVASYVGGRQLVNKVTHFPESENKQIEAMCLVTTTTVTQPDDFWELRFAEYANQKEQLRHGRTRTWHSNGQLQSDGFFQYDLPTGAFVWWHAHGQEAVKGNFVDGQPDGTWTWWHANGQKAAEGRYNLGKQVGIWQKWADDGRLVQRISAEAGPLVAGSQERPQHGRFSRRQP